MEFWKFESLVLAWHQGQLYYTPQLWNTTHFNASSPMHDSSLTCDHTVSLLFPQQLLTQKNNIMKIVLEISYWVLLQASTTINVTCWLLLSFYTIMPQGNKSCSLSDLISFLTALSLQQMVPKLRVLKEKLMFWGKSLKYYIEMKGLLDSQILLLVC